jgi:hypothetical protein
MLIRLNSKVCVNDAHIVKMTLLEGATSFTIRGQHEPIVAKGDWIKKIVRAKQVGAVYLDSLHHDLGA